MCRSVVLLGLCLVSLSSWADVFGDAQWLRDPRMDGQPIIEYLYRQQVPAPAATGPKNIHTLLRKAILLRGKPKSAHLFITGDDYYKFSINGQPVVQGPEGGYFFSYPYYWLDVTEFLSKGENCLASHAYYQGLRNRVWGSGDNRSGFMLRLDVTYADGAAETFYTDDSWRVHSLLAFTGEKTMGYDTQYPENIDMRAMPVGWERPGFDDSGWTTPLIGRQDHVFVQQATPPLQVYRVEPKWVKAVGDHGFFYDFGTEIVGHTRVQIEGSSGDVITVRHAEELDAEGRARHMLRAGMNYDEKVTLSGGKDITPFYDYRAFRYMEVLGTSTPPVVWVEVRHHPFDAAASKFTSSDKALENIFAICKNGVQMGAQGGFLDCPTREKGQYLGDAVIAGRSHLWLTGEGSLTRKALYDFYLSCQIHPGMMAVAPGHFMQEIAEFPLQYPILLEAYYEHTGDAAMLDAMATNVFPGLFDYYATFEDKSGLIVGLNKPEKWLVVDWPGNMRGGYDYDYAASRANTLLNGFYYGALRTAARLERTLGRDADAYDAKADRVAQAFAEQMVDPETGLYLDAPGSKHSSLHANAIPLAFGLTAGADKDKMLAFIAEKGLDCGVYIASYVIEACFRAGAPDLGYALLTNDTDHGWKEMLRAGATTCLETWSPDQKGNASFCHPWSSSPVYLIAEQVFGISPTTPGWSSLRIAPPRIKDLPAMKLTVPLPQGPLSVSYTPEAGYKVAAPDGVTVDFQAPTDNTPGKPKTAGAVATVKEEEPMAEDMMTRLDARGWNKNVGEGLGAWVDVANQRFYLIENRAITWEVPCATAAAGTGSISGSLRTPLGWHRVDRKFGENAPWGQVFRSRVATKEIWKPGDNVTEDLVLTRVLWLDGLEPGINKGKTPDGILVDSKERCIYIHGTNGEALIGTPSSHGCIRLLNDDVLLAFDRLPIGTPVLITE